MAKKHKSKKATRPYVRKNAAPTRGAATSRTTSHEDPADAYLKARLGGAVSIRLMSSSDVVATDISVPAVVRGALAWAGAWALGVREESGRVILVPRHAIGTVEPGGAATAEESLGFIE